MMRIGAVIKTTGLSKSSIYALIACGKFPRQVKLSERCVGWLDDEVIGWLDAKINARDDNS